MLTDDFLLYIMGVRRYSRRTQEIYAGILKEFNEYAASYSLPQEPAASQEGKVNADVDFILRAMDKTIIRNYEVYLSDERKLNARTINQHLSVLSSFCRWLMGQGLLKCNPVKLVSRPKCEKRLPVFYRQDSMEDYFRETLPSVDGESLKALENVAGSLHDGTPTSSSAYKLASDLYSRRLRRMIISTLYETGMRRAELISLRIGSIDFSRRIITVRGKGNKMREIPLTPALSKEILLYLKAAEAIVGRERTANEPFLITLTGAGVYPVLVDRAVKSELGNVDSITGRKSPHVLRHTLATELLNDGSDLYSIKELLGHSSLAATQVYTHNTIEKLKSVYLNAHPRARNTSGIKDDANGNLSDGKPEE